ncbi:hypothetical protein B0H65DRAFT_218302 [Neurospora tetraspora]|uniref:Uncharacterized protein n=1 Tax=Neurospora tetraspora TaxID=94610 RepID=A0AAE0MQI6_9PEZI|nr:hypothetical protein B0H65DRAFT_218302 [Neurospora tetraspora]
MSLNLLPYHSSYHPRYSTSSLCLLLCLLCATVKTNTFSPGSYLLLFSLYLSLHLLLSLLYYQIMDHGPKGGFQNEMLPLRYLSNGGGGQILLCPRSQMCIPRIQCVAAVISFACTNTKFRSRLAVCPPSILGVDIPQKTLTFTFFCQIGF